MLLNRLLLLAGLATTLAAPACTEKPKEAARLPILGERDVVPRADGGPADTVYQTVPAFQLTNQAGQPVTNQTFAGRAYVTDFFFATCPGICPKLQGSLLKVYQPLAADPRIGFLSITIDPQHDSTAVLKDYAERLGVRTADRWHFASLGDRAKTFELANHLLTGVMPDSQAPGGLAHNGVLALVDDRGYIRGAYDGLNAEQVANLQRDIPVLLAEIEGRKKGVAKQ
ncbi:SCO family protein [Hymenobacter monticola]|uniref:SCO family protein n=1 Tax=Hymenobacter monticola TaxID=1705399 RepID=A0ABY4B646_9BACT|nr:SCO family protein [Hymenobacter monticola]UOE33491.1 SCO family protein [Hymenobacter monticola]